uniref:amino acid adenylation domain-containing protein n=1 Tax=Paraburkholderia sp. J63 TaxID=2805434 RepID=UPI002ABDE207
GFGLLKYAGAEEDRAALADATPSTVVFNYLGQLDRNDRNTTQTAPWRLSADPATHTHDTCAPLMHALSIGARVIDGAMGVEIAYSAERYRAATIEQFAAAFHQALEALIAHCTSGATGATPSDFPLASLTQAELDALPVPASAIEDLYPLSPMQTGMLFHTLTTRGGEYVTQLRIDVTGLDARRFEAAWQAASARHAALRTGFVASAGGWLQWVAREAVVPFEHLDWRVRTRLDDALDDTPHDALADALNDFANEDVARGFDLATPPLQRVTLIATGEHRHHLVWTHHHAVIDGWSMAQLLAEVMRLYGGETLPAPRGRYRDYIAWSRPSEAQVAQSFWRERLGALAGPTHIVPARASGNAVRRSTATHALTLDAAATARLVALARATHVTVNTVVQAAWALVLRGLTGQSSVVFGTTVAGRPVELADAQTVVGLFINTIPVAAHPRAAMTAAAWLRELQAQGSAALEHAYAPLHEIQRWAQAQASAEGLFDTLLVFENYPVDAVLKEASPGGLVFGEPLARDETNYPLTIAALLGDAMTLNFTYATDRIDAATVAQWARRMQGALDALCESPDRKVGEIESVEARERQELLALSRVDERYEERRPVHRVIAAQARATPDAVALEFGEHALSYRELDAQANRLAHRLIALGVGPEVRVGIAVERSVEMVVGLLAILKAGGAYVPLDPEYPRERLAYMIEDSGIALLLTQARVRDALPVPVSLVVLELDTLDLSMEPATDPAVPVDVENLAYVIYTSGSTGRPKGAANRHGALTNRLVWMQQAYGLDASDTVLQKTPFSFDVSVWEFFWPLMVGAKLAVAQPGDHRDPARLVALVERHGVTTLHFVPSMLHAFVAHGDAARCAGLKRIVCSGEALPAELAQRALALLPDAGLYNLYGPTEAAIDVTHWTCVAGGGSVPIGRPIANVQTYVLDGALNLAPRGVAGELYLGGAGLARGYLDRAALTAERFVPDPFGREGERLYRTGDLARWNAEGALDYLGRIDHQVKIRGFRIELGEIEAQLAAQAGVREAVVTAQDGAGGTRLVAYVTARAEAALDVAALREALAQTLPDYMVPGVIMVLEAMPLNPNGKVDRKALPQPEIESAAEYEAPEGATETAIAEIWRELLGVARVSRHDSFFALGGHSLLAMQLIARLNHTLKLDVPVETVFTMDTLQSFSAHLDAQVPESRAIDERLDELASFLDVLEGQ